MTLTGRVTIARRFGPPEVITIEDHPRPALGRGQVRVAVRAGGLNPVDARRRAGTFPANAPLALGSEFSGTVLESTDPRWKPGDAVVGWRAPGSDGDLVVTSGDLLAAKPDDVSWCGAIWPRPAGAPGWSAASNARPRWRSAASNAVHGRHGRSRPDEEEMLAHDGPERSL